MKYRISQASIDLIESFEGCPQKNGYAIPYQDVVGVWTIGYGLTRIGGTRVTQYTNPIPIKIIEHLFLKELLPFVVKAYRDIKDINPDPDELGAVASFCFNLGNPSFHRSTLRKRINSKSVKAEIERQFLKWKYAGGRELSGLLRRRQAESNLFNRPVFKKSPEPL